MAELQKWGATHVHRRILSGSPAVKIVKAARESSADLIVVASGSGGLSVLHPVLVSRPKP